VDDCHKGGRVGQSLMCQISGNVRMSNVDVFSLQAGLYCCVSGKGEVGS
jgi:hypothetical protein